MKSVVPSCFGDRGSLYYRPRDTYVDAEFDGEFIADVYFLFWESFDDENLKKRLKIFPGKYFPAENIFGQASAVWDYARADALSATDTMQEHTTIWKVRPENIFGNNF